MMPGFSNGNGVRKTGHRYSMAMVAGNGCMPWKDQWVSISVATSSALIEAG